MLEPPKLPPRHAPEISIASSSIREEQAHAEPSLTCSRRSHVNSADYNVRNVSSNGCPEVSFRIKYVWPVRLARAPRQIDPAHLIVRAVCEKGRIFLNV